MSHTQSKMMRLTFPDSEVLEEENQTLQSYTEQENTSDESEEEETMEAFFIGKNKSRKCCKTIYYVSIKTNGMNITTIITDMTQRALGIVCILPNYRYLEVHKSVCRSVEN